jgi:Nif-specific regulatory protein
MPAGSDHPDDLAGEDVGLVGGSRPMRELAGFIARAAPTDSTVLIDGPSGTGKELVARALHSRSRRARGPFVAVNSAAMPESLIESELFGHERGAFTGAVAAGRGKFELADGGTLFLDEVGELAVAIQAKLLRAIEAREIDRIGGRGPIAVDFRLVAATNRDMEAAVRDGSFRADLYYRLKVLEVRTPPLVERREDISDLARHFLRQHAARAGSRVDGIAPEAMAILEGYDWPGNVRELSHAIEHAVVMSPGAVVGPEALPRAVVRGATGWPTYSEAVYDTKRRLFEAAFARACGDYRQAARLLGLHPKAIHRLLGNLDLGHLLKKSAV